MSLESPNRSPLINHIVNGPIKYFMKLDGVFKVIHENQSYVHVVNLCVLCEHNMVVGYKPVVCGDCLELNVRCKECKVLLYLSGLFYIEEEVKTRICGDCKRKSELNNINSDSTFLVDTKNRQ